MKKGLTELVFILDRSGSMNGLEEDTIGGFNSFLAKQQEVDGECRLTTVLFDDSYELLHDRIDIKGVGAITEKEYYVGGSTALIDAIGRTVSKIVNVQKSTAEEHRAEKVMFVIITDGMENASREYSTQQVKEMVEHEKEKYGWEFIFLGANIDAVEVAGHFGIDRNRAQNYHADSMGTTEIFDGISESTLMYRLCAEVPDDWNAKLKKDFTSRRRGIRK